MDSPDIVDMGLSQMLLLVVDHNLDAELEVFFSISFNFISKWLFQCFTYLPCLLPHGLKALYDYIMQVHLVGGFEDVSPNVWLGILIFIIDFPEM